MAERTEWSRAWGGDHRPGDGQCPPCLLAVTEQRGVPVLILGIIGGAPIIVLPQKGFWARIELSPYLCSLQHGILKQYMVTLNTHQTCILKAF